MDSRKAHNDAEIWYTYHNAIQRRSGAENTLRHDRTSWKDAGMGAVRIPLSSRKYPDLYAIVDDQDYEKVSQYRWHPDMTYPDRPYAKTNVPGMRGKLLKMHRVITAAPDGATVDHINGNTLDNRRSNLRIVTAAQNLMNKRPHRRASSAFKGVCWDNSKRRWRAYIQGSGRMIHLGYFNAERDAAIAYDIAATELFGEFAKTNGLQPGDLDPVNGGDA